jgi:hypothetical protein
MAASCVGRTPSERNRQIGRGPGSSSGPRPSPSPDPGVFGDDRKHDLEIDPIGSVEGGSGELEQEVLLAGHALQVVEQLTLHPAFGTRADMVNGLDQEVDQVIGQLTLAKMHEGCEPGEPGVPQSSEQKRTVSPSSAP